MPCFTCRSCGALFQDRGRHSRHLGGKNACQQFYNNLAQQRASYTHANQNCPLNPPSIIDAGRDSPSPELPAWQNEPDPQVDIDAATKRRHVTVEEIEDEETIPEPWVYEDYPGLVAQAVGKSVTHFEDLRAEQEALNKSPHSPFRDADEWSLARWIDELPSGPKWLCEIINITGDVKGPNGEFITKELEIWRRNPVECCRELIGNPVFKSHMAYSPVRVKCDGTRYYSEMNTADWWWDKQAELPPSAVLSPIILASDKTNLTTLCGDKTAWPVYLSLGNIDKSVRRKPSAHAVLLLGYIPVTKLHSFAKSTQADASYQLFHTCMEWMLAPLVEAGRTGVLMTCANRVVRRQCLITCFSRNKRGENKQYKLRDHIAAIDVLRHAGTGKVPSDPDILHQSHKGVIKDHLVVWCEKVIGKKALDERFAAMSKAYGLRHFPRGLSVISQWTGSEAKEIEKILLSLLVGRVSTHVMKAIRGLLDFTYYAQYKVHSDTTLARMHVALNTFHRNKSALIELGVREHFNIPKLHSLIHYVDAIVKLGCLDGLNTENSERLHIDVAKKAYRASSRREYVAQMTTWLQQQEAVERQTAYLAWIGGVLADKMKADGDFNEHDNGQVTDEDNSTQERSADKVRALPAFQLPLTPSAGRVGTETLASKYGALDFVLELNDFLRTYHPTVPPASDSILLDVYHLLTVLLPANVHINNQKRICKLRTSPLSPRFRDRKAVPARFDCGLFLEDNDAFEAEGGLTGQVCCIFRLPTWMGLATPLLYINWFCPFRVADNLSGLHPTSTLPRSPADLVRTCHLIPKFGHDNVDPRWTQDDVLDEPITFLLNRYYNFHTFESLSS
ncbi:hypothetical protein BC628DRAFT_1412307 [Trametes gibbosa]|nr:hypothetical protein BC628DRAFT_1412307 [Trametes gibbosa]